MNWFDNWALTIAVFLPLVGAVVTMFWSKGDEIGLKLIALITTVATFGVTIAIAARFNYDRAGL